MSRQDKCSIACPTRQLTKLSHYATIVRAVSRVILPSVASVRVALSALGTGAHRATGAPSVTAVDREQASVDRSPVCRAAVRSGAVVTFTNRAGVAVVRVRGSRRLTVTAGDTLRPASLVIRR